MAKTSYKPDADKIAQELGYMKKKADMEKELTFKSPLEQANALKEKNEDYYLSPEYEQEILGRMKQAREFMNPRSHDAQIKFNTALMKGEPLPDDPNILSIDAKTYKSLLQDYHNIYKGRYNKIAQQLGRKDYGDFRPYLKETNGHPDISGADRIYAFFKKAYDEPGLDFARMVMDDRRENPNIKVPTDFEFADQKFKLSPDYRSGDHWKKEGNDWRHISTGTGYGYWGDIFKLLQKENFK